MLRFHNKKGLFIYILIFMMIFSYGCKPKTKDSKEGREFDVKIANNVVDSYMRYVMNNDMNSAKKLYSKKLTNSKAEKRNSDLKTKGYLVSEINEIGESGIFKSKVVSINEKIPYTCVEEFKIKVVKEGNDYKIEEINTSNEKEAFIEKNQIRYRNKNNIKTELLIDGSGIPDYTYAKDDKSRLEKIPVPKSNIGAITLAYSENFIAISTYDKNSYIGLVTIDESKAVQGGSGSGDGESGGSGGGGDSQGGSITNVKEPPIGKEISDLDLLKNSKIDYMVFSPDEKFVAVQYETSAKSKNLRVYKTDSGDMIDSKFEDKYPLDKVNVIFSSFNMEEINFDVIAKDKNNKEVSKVTGKWQLNLKDFKFKKI